MPDLFKRVFKGFTEASGHWILLGIMGSRLLSLLASWLAFRLVSSEDLAPAIYAFQIIAFLIPFMGMGLFHGVLKYGAEYPDIEKRMALYHRIIKRGRAWNMILVLALTGSGFIWDWGFEESGVFIMIFAWMLFFSFEYEMQRVAFRLTGQNGYFALSEMMHWGAVLLFIGLGARFYGAVGYAMAYVLAPALLVVYWQLRKPELFRSGNAKSLGKPLSIRFMSYGIFNAFSNVVTRLLFAVDIILIGSLMSQESSVTIYKYLTLIPFSAQFLSRAYMTTHFVELSGRMRDRGFIRRFIREYHVLFAAISIVFLLFSWVFAPLVLGFFGPELVPYTRVFIVLAAGVTGILFLRGLYGNILSACGKANLSFYAGLIGLLFNILSNYWLIPRYGLMGAAITSAAVMWLTGLLSALFFKLFCPTNVGI